MRRSKMEMHLDILKILAKKGPLKLTHIMYKSNVNCSVLKEYLGFLIKQELIEEHIETTETGRLKVIQLTEKSEALLVSN